MNISITYLADFPLQGWDRLVFDLGLKSLFANKSFYSCDFANLVKKLNRTEEYNKSILSNDLQSLHCVSYTNMKRDIFHRLPIKIGSFLSVRIEYNDSEKHNFRAFKVELNDADVSKLDKWDEWIVKSVIHSVFNASKNGNVFRYSGRIKDLRVKVKNRNILKDGLLESQGNVYEDDSQRLLDDFEIIDDAELSHLSDADLDCLIQKFNEYTGLSLLVNRNLSAPVGKLFNPSEMGEPFTHESFKYFMIYVFLIVFLMFLGYLIIMFTPIGYNSNASVVSYPVADSSRNRHAFLPNNERSEIIKKAPHLNQL